LSAYTPLPISGRMLLPFLPCGLVIAAIACDASLERFTATRSRMAIAIAIAATVIVPAARLMIVELRRATPEADSFAFVRAEAVEQRRLAIVCAEPRCMAIASFYFGFAVPPNVTLIDAADMPALDNVTVRVLVNVPRGRGEHDRGRDFTARIDALGLTRL